MSINIHADASAVQLAMETTTKLSQLGIVSTSKNSTRIIQARIIGYIHELGQKPFGYVLISNLQVCFVCIVLTNQLKNKIKLLINFLTTMCI